MKKWTSLERIKNVEYKILYKRILITLMILFIYIFGSHIEIADMKAPSHLTGSFLGLAVANIGGNIKTLNLFSLGLSPWLTTMIIMSLLAYINADKDKISTRLEKHFKERVLTLLFAVVQGYFILSEYMNRGVISQTNFVLLLLILITGTLFLTWLVDQNVLYGIAGPTPIILVSIIKSIFQNQRVLFLNQVVLVIGIVVIIVILLLLLLMELVEYRMGYHDIMNVSHTQKETYISWKINPAGSVALMFNFALFFFLGVLIKLIGRWVEGDPNFHTEFLELNHPLGVLTFLVMLMVLNYCLSVVMLNAKRKAKMFQRSANYIEGIYPGQQTEQFLKRKSRRLSVIGAVILGLIMSLPLALSLFTSNVAQHVSTFTQLIVFIYITINITEHIRTYLYFDRYTSVLEKYR